MKLKRWSKSCVHESICNFHKLNFVFKVGTFLSVGGLQGSSCNRSGRALLTSQDKALRDQGTDLKKHVVRVLVPASVRVRISSGGRKKRVLCPDMHGHGIVAK